MSNPQVIYSGESYLVLDKPTGWVVNSATTTNAPVIEEWLQKSMKELVILEVERSGIVHRLDKETSGVLIVARTESAMLKLQNQFKERAVVKEYLALVHGKVKAPGVVKLDVGRLPWNRERFGAVNGGRESETSYEIVGVYRNKDGEFTLLRLKPKTGRTHQIRIHMKHIGHPVVSDTFYAGRKTSRRDREWCPRLFLHAAKISFMDPDTHKQVLHESGLPRDLLFVLSKLIRM